MVLFNQQQCLPKYWTLPMITNFGRHPLNDQSTEYTFVSDKFYQSWGNLKNQPSVPTNVPPNVPTNIPPLQIRLPPPPPPLSAPVPPTNNLPQHLFSIPMMSPMRMMHPLTNINSSNNNSSGSTGNSSLPPPPSTMPNYAFPPMPPPISIPTNTMTQQGSLNSLPLPPSRPRTLPRSLLPALPPGPPIGPFMGPPPGPHSNPPIGHPIGPPLGPPLGAPPPVPYYGPAMPFTGPNTLPQLPTNNNVPVRIRQHRSTNPAKYIPQIIQIERIQNQRWYKQYSAHECEFRQKLGKQTEQWLFHGK